MGTEGVCLAPEGSQSFLHLPGVGVRVRVGHQSSGGGGGPSPLPPGRHWVVSHFPLEQFHSPVKPAAKAHWDGDPSPGKEVGERMNTPTPGTAPGAKPPGSAPGRKRVTDAGPGPCSDPARVFTGYITISRP